MNEQKGVYSYNGILLRLSKGREFWHNVAQLEHVMLRDDSTCTQHLEESSSQRPEGKGGYQGLPGVGF